MAKTQWLLLLTTCIVSCGSVAILIVSYLTNNWVSAQFNTLVFKFPDIFGLDDILNKKELIVMMRAS